MGFIKLTAQEKYIWKHSKYEIQAYGLAEAESGWGWDGENPAEPYQPGFNDEAKSSGLIDTCWVILNQCISPD